MNRDSRDRTISKLQRQAERRARHIIGLMDKNDRLKQEVDRLQKKLLAVYINSPKDSTANKIAQRTIPREILKYEIRRAARESEPQE